MKLKRLEAAAFLAFALVVILSVANFENKCQGIRDNCFRLHIIANSDREEDQSLKLKVRDELLKSTAHIFENAKNKDEALSLALTNADKIKETAESVIKKQGYCYTVQIDTAKAYFPTRTYEKYTLPAGKYDALRVIIGEGKGKNWWCVMFPSLCLPASMKKDKLSDVLTEKEIELIEKNPRYEIRFWIVEQIQKLKSNKKGS